MSTIRRGDKGAKVRRLQALLRDLGAPIDDTDGLFDLDTEAAVYAVQRAAGLVADGVVGPVTAERLSANPPAGAFSGGRLYTRVAGVPYLSQRDNANRPSATCNVTALAMALMQQGVTPEPGRQLEDELYELLEGPEALAHYKTSSPDLFRARVPAQEVYDNLVWAAERYGLVASFSTSRSLDEIGREIEAGRPVLLSGLFTGAGHVLLLIGLTAAGDLICNDPFGDWNRGYRDRRGEARIYEMSRARSVLKTVGTDEKWGLFLR